MRSFHYPGRSAVYGTKAMCACSHPAASLTAIEILKAGGNGVDAAIAASAVLCVVEPAMTGIGGDCFALIAKPGKAPIALNASGRAPAAATLERITALGVSELEMTSPHAVTIPGAIDGWARLSVDHGSMTLKQCLEPAIAMAEQGMVVAPRVGSDWAQYEDKLRLHSGARQHLLINERAPKPGETMTFPELAQTLRIIAEEGREGFYTGAVATDMVSELNELGGLHTIEDFAAQQAGYVTPISVPYGPIELYELPPNTQGVVALIILKVLSRLGRLSNHPGCATRYHVLLEVARLAYAARDRFVADPEMAEVPVSHMLSEAFADDLAGRIDRGRRTPDLGPAPEPADTDTIYLSVVDEGGMAVSFINSLYSAFGSGIVTRKSGIALQNRGQGFTLQAGHANSLAPGKRPLHTLVPAIAMKNGKPWLSFGVMGGMFQPLGHAFVITNMVDYGMDPQEALDCPRVFFDGDGTGAEHSLPVRTFDALATLGHDMKRVQNPWGGGQIVCFDHDNDVLIGASDPRKDGIALGY